MVVDVKKRRRRKGATTPVGQVTVGKIRLTVKSNNAETVFNLIRQLALLTRIRSISLSIKAPGRVQDIVLIYRNPPESGLLREKVVLKALNPLVDYFDREDVAIKGIIQTEGKEDEINEWLKAFNTRNTVAVIN